MKKVMLTGDWGACDSSGHDTVVRDANHKTAGIYDQREPAKLERNQRNRRKAKADQGGMK
jgi:hypothetical protein